jgi:hypothetical protein
MSERLRSQNEEASTAQARPKYSPFFQHFIGEVLYREQTVHTPSASPDTTTIIVLYWLITHPSIYFILFNAFHSKL